MSGSKTAVARASEQQTSSDRWTLTSNLEDLYNNGEGSLYTNLPAANLPSAGSAPDLNTQIKEGVKFFGYGRGSHTDRLGTQGQKEEGEIRVGGMLSGEKQATQTGDISDLGGFNTFRAPRSVDSDFGKDLIATRDKSWFTKNVTEGSKNKYGNKLGKESGRGSSSRGRTDSGSASGKQSAY
jgi:hypothetical protein